VSFVALALIALGIAGYQLGIRSSSTPSVAQLPSVEDDFTLPSLSIQPESLTQPTPETSGDSVPTSSEATGNPAPASEATSPQIPRYLLAESENRAGVSLGYLTQAAEPLASTLPLVSTARAAAVQYAPTMFYAKAVDGIPQLFSYTLKNKTETQLTTNQEYGYGKPVFSSMSQQLAYERYPEWNASRNQPYYGRCEVIVRDMKANQVLWRSTSKPDTCLRPVAWSSDGTKLLLLQVVLGDATQNKFLVYVAPSAPLAELARPADISPNTPVGFGDWVSNDEIIGSYWSSTKQWTPYRHTLSSGAAEKLNVPLPNAKSFTTALDQLFFLTRPTISSDVTERIAYISLSDAGTAREVNGPTAVYDYLLRPTDDTERISEIVYSNALNTTEMPGGIYTVPVGGGTPELKKKTFSDTPTFVGWAEDYYTVIYRITPGGSGSGGAEIHALNLKTNLDTTLLSGLTLSE
jgi:hypothetical protein